MANEIGNGSGTNSALLGAYYTQQHISNFENLLTRAASDTVPAPDFNGNQLAESGLLNNLGTTGTTGGTNSSVIGSPHRADINPVDFSDPISQTATALTNLLDQTTGLAFSLPSDPDPRDAGHPDGSLKVNNGVVITPGGYKIEATKQHEWIITGPDGKTTRIWGDPHVDEGDGGKWDFKRDSTFVLADGTRINVTTKPWGDKGWTVTGGLEIIAGNQRVNITDIDKGKGKIGDITNDGYQRVNAFGNKDVFVMGKETDDWSFTGKEIIGSEKQGEKFKLGKDLEAGVVKPLVAHTGDAKKFFAALLDRIDKLFKALEEARVTGKLPDLGKLELPDVTPASTSCWGKSGTNNQKLELLGTSFRAVATMFDALSRLLNLTASIPPRRGYQTV